MSVQSTRIRLPPTRYAEQSLQGPQERSLTMVELGQQQVNQVLHAQLSANRASIEEKAQEFACPLMKQAPRKVSVRPSGVRYEQPQECAFLGVQAKKLAVASDGHYYDFARITQYIRDHMHHELLSPVTGEPMAAVVYHTAKGRKNGELKTVTWTPDLFVSDEESEKGAGARASASQPIVAD